MSPTYQHAETIPWNKVDGSDVLHLRPSMAVGGVLPTGRDLPINAIGDTVFARLERSISVLALLTMMCVSGFAGQTAQAADELCFPETQQCISGRFREYWTQNGGLAVFGYPITPARDEINRDTGRTYLTQWFERNRFELHPENAAPYDVLLGRLGDDRLQQTGRDWRAEGREQGPRAGCLWFEQTGHNVCNEGGSLGFRQYWETHGLQDPRLNPYQRSLALFGLPLTEPRMETNSSGDRVQTQWFERARFEWHPNNPTAFRVLLGRLGAEVRDGTGSGDLPGGRIVYISARDIFAGGDLHMMNADGSGQRRLTFNEAIPLEGSEYVLSPMGDRVAYRIGSQLLVASTAPNPPPPQLIAIWDTGAPPPPILFSPVWAPDGSHVAYLWQGNIYASKADGTPPVQITQSGDISAPACLSWARNGYLSFRKPGMRTFSLWVVRSNGSDARQVGFGLCGTLSPNGDRMSFLNGGDLWVMDADGSNPRALTTGRNLIPGIWSPDGTRLLTVESNPLNSYQSDIVVIDVQSGVSRTLTSDPNLDAMPSWSPDGRHITFASKRTLRYGVYVMRADGSNQRSLATSQESSMPQWAP